MLVVADTSPLVVLSNIGHLDLLPALFGQILIPTAVASELSYPRRPVAVRALAAATPAWLVVRQPIAIESIPEIDLGEREAISLAMEVRADLLLIDDAAGRLAAAGRGLAITGTIGLLERAADQQLLDLAEAFERVKRTDFWVNPRLLDKRLQLFTDEKRSP